MRVNMDDPAIRMSEAFWAWFLRGKTIISIFYAILAVGCWWASQHSNPPTWMFASLVVAECGSLLLAIIFPLFWLADLVNDHWLATASLVALVTGIGVLWYSHPLRYYPSPSVRGDIIAPGAAAILMGLWGLRAKKPFVGISAAGAPSRAVEGHVVTIWRTAPAQAGALFFYMVAM
jgi:hypothetical protein